MRKISLFILLVVIIGVWGCKNNSENEPHTHIPYLKWDKWGFYKDTSLIISTDFDMVNPFIADNAVVKINDKYGVIDKKGQFLIEVSYDFLKGVNAKLFIAEKNGKLGLINKKNEIIVPFEYDEIKAHILADLLIVKNENKFGLISTKGKIIIDLKYDKIYYPTNDICIVEQGGMFKYLNINTQKEIAVGSKNNSFGYSEGLALIEQTSPMKKIGFYDTKGVEVIPLNKYEEVHSFSNGLAAVKLNGKWGFIDKKGEIIIEPQYIDCIIKSDELTRVNTVFSEEIAFVKNNEGFGGIDTKGNNIIPFSYTKAKPFSEGLANVKYEYKWGVIDKGNNTIVGNNYQDIEPFSRGIAKAQNELGNWFFIDMNGIEYKDSGLPKLSEEIAKDKIKNFFIEKYGSSTHTVSKTAEYKVSTSWKIEDGSTVDRFKQKYLNKNENRNVAVEGRGNISKHLLANDFLYATNVKKSIQSFGNNGAIFVDLEETDKFSELIVERWEKRFMRKKFRANVGYYEIGEISSIEYYIDRGVAEVEFKVDFNETNILEVIRMFIDEYPSTKRGKLIYRFNNGKWDEGYVDMPYLN